MRDKYKYIGPVYDFLSNLYSGKNIHRCKTAMLDVETIRPGARILFCRRGAWPRRHPCRGTGRRRHRG